MPEDVAQARPALNDIRMPSASHARRNNVIIARAISACSQRTRDPYLNQLICLILRLGGGDAERGRIRSTSSMNAFQHSSLVRDVDARFNPRVVDQDRSARWESHIDSGQAC